MADESQKADKECEEGAPEWMVTFADLSTLLLCFFVLLLSFSQMDVAKFKELRGSLEKAFGVQRLNPVYDVPKGMTLIARDFDQIFVQQLMVGNNANHSSSSARAEGEGELDGSERGELEGEKALAALLKELSDEGIIEVETDAIGRIIMRLLGTTTFDSGRATIKPTMIDMLNKIGTVIGKTNRDILVAGHTDNVPLQGGPYGSNLGLSAARAASVVDFFLQRNLVPPEKIATLAFGEHRPLAPNDSPANRETNRRVEIILAAIQMPYEEK